MFFRKIRYWFRYRRHLKILRKMPPGEWAKEVKRFFPDSESPLMELTKRLNTPGAIIPEPRFKMFGTMEEEDTKKSWLQLLRIISSNPRLCAEYDFDKVIEYVNKRKEQCSKN